MKISGASFQSVRNFENDEFKHRTWQGEIYAKYKLNLKMYKKISLNRTYDVEIGQILREINWDEHLDLSKLILLKMQHVQTFSITQIYVKS